MIWSGLLYFIILYYINLFCLTSNQLDVRQPHQYNSPLSVSLLSHLSHSSHRVRSAVISGRYITRIRVPCELCDLPAGFTEHSFCSGLQLSLLLKFQFTEEKNKPILFTPVQCLFSFFV